MKYCCAELKKSLTEKGLIPIICYDESGYFWINGPQEALIDKINFCPFCGSNLLFVICDLPSSPPSTPGAPHA